MGSNPDKLYSYDGSRQRPRRPQTRIMEIKPEDPYTTNTAVDRYAKLKLLYRYKTILKRVKWLICSYLQDGNVDI